MIDKKKWIKFGAILLTSLLCYFPLCHRINTYCIQLWDESRNLTNAIEMLNNHKWLTRYFENQPDMWELKPPFLVWCQALSLKLFGFNEVAARLPSVFFSIATLVFIIWFVNKLTGQIYGGLIASIVLVSSIGYVGEHGARFGDHDVVLAFFSTTLVCFGYLFIETNRTKYLILLFVVLFFGWFTKSITIFMFLPAILFLSVSQKKLKLFLLNRSFWVGCFILVGLILFYFLIREKASPGYFNEVWMNELFGRYFGVSKDYVYEKNEFWYYAEGFLDGRLSPFFILFLIGSIYVFFTPNLQNRKVLIFLFITVLTFFTIISAGTKNYWYDLPLYPLVALFIGILSFQIYQRLTNTGYRMAFNFVFVILIYSGYSTVFRYIFIPETHTHENWRSLCYYLKDENNTRPKHLKIIHNSYFAPLYLYIADAKTKNIQITLSKTINVQVGDTCLMNDILLINRTDSLFETNTIFQNDSCVLKSIISSKF